METLPRRKVETDPGTLSPEQLEQLRDFKIQTRITNEKYLRTHKEVSLLISGFFRPSSPANPFAVLQLSWVNSTWPLSGFSMGEMFLKRPDNILEFAAHYFTDPRLPNKIHMQLIKDKKEA